MEKLKNIKEEGKRILTGHHITNIILTVSFYLSKVLPPICTYLYPKHHCQIELREYEILLFLAIVIMMKNRKASSWLHYLATVFTFFKLGNMLLFYRIEPKLAVIYGLICIVQMVLFPQPGYTGPEVVTYFRGPYLHDELQRDTRKTWLIEFYAGWSPPCVHLHPVFAQLSTKYGLDNLKFGKLDVGNYPKEAERFKVSTQPTCKQLPTVVLFQNGVEVCRRPLVDRNSRCLNYVFSADNIIADFDLNNIYAECKKNLPKSRVKTTGESPTGEKKTN